MAVNITIITVVGVHYSGGGDGMTESLSHLSETSVLPSLSQLVTIGYQLQRNLTQLLVSIMHLSLCLSVRISKCTSLHDAVTVVYL